MPNVTPNYGFFLPLVNDPTDQDLWGGYLNDNWSSLDSLLGNLTPSGDFCWSALSAKTGWLLCFAQAVSRTTYSSLFTAIGTTYGSGDGSTTFNLPDARGRTLAGVDNMGGTAASRITTGVAGFDGTALGAAGGDQNSQLHDHALTDPGHNHTPQGGGTFATYNGSTSITPVSGGGNLNGASSTTTNSTGITIASYGGGNSQNVQPTMMANLFIKT